MSSEVVLPEARNADWMEWEFRMREAEREVDWEEVVGGRFEPLTLFQRG